MTKIIGKKILPENLHCDSQTDYIKTWKPFCCVFYIYEMKHDRGKTCGQKKKREKILFYTKRLKGRTLVITKLVSLRMEFPNTHPLPLILLFQALHLHIHVSTQKNDLSTQQMVMVILAISLEGNIWYSLTRATLFFTPWPLLHPFSEWIL